MKINKIINYLLLAVTILLLVSGYGITQWQTVGPLTFGLLDKATAFKLHGTLTIPFIILLVLHVFRFSIKKR